MSAFDFVLLVPPAQEVGLEFDAIRAAQAHQILKSTAIALDMQEEVNAAGMFPRIVLQNMQDSRRVVKSLVATTRELKMTFVNAVGRYAMGNAEMQFSDLESMAAEYLDSTRLTAAAIVHHHALRKEVQKRQEADQRAAGAYATMDERMGPLACVKCGVPAVREDLTTGQWFCENHGRNGTETI